MPHSFCSAVFKCLALPAWLQARGLDPAPMLIRIVAVPLATKLIDHRGGATAQGDFSAIQGGTIAAAMGVAGVLVAAFGSAAYFAMAAVAAVGLATAFAARRTWRESYPT
jgi:hypothetical protein